MKNGKEMTNQERGESCEALNHSYLAGDITGSELDAAMMKIAKEDTNERNNKGKGIASALGMQIEDFAEYFNGFSFTVSEELQAYKAANKYQMLRTVVRYAPNVGRWSVQVYVR